MLRRCLTVMGLLVSIILASGAQTASSQSVPPKRTPIVMLKFEFAKNAPVPIISVTVNGGKPCRLMVDTGFTGCAITKEFTKKHNIPLMPPLTKTGEPITVNGKPVEGLVRLSDITFAGVPALDISCIVISEQETAKVIGEPVDGVLGAMFIEKSVLALDYGKKEMLFWTPQAMTKEDIAQSDWAGSVAVPLSLSDSNLFTLKAKVNGKKETVLAIDTGSSHTVLPTKVGESLKLPYELRPYEVVGGTITVRKIDLEILSIGDVVWKDLEVHYPDPKTPNAFNAVLGARELSQYRILFDGIGKVAYFQPLPKKATKINSPEK